MADVDIAVVDRLVTLQRELETLRQEINDRIRAAELRLEAVECAAGETEEIIRALARARVATTANMFRLHRSVRKAMLQSAQKTAAPTEKGAENETTPKPAAALPPSQNATNQGRRHLTRKI